MSCVRALFLSLALLKVDVSWSLRNVCLLITPPLVQLGKNLELRCDYDLQGAPLYSIKFYRGRHEFYRYTPSDVPHVRLFPFPGLYVDLSKSTSNVVILYSASYNLAGEVSCEVSTDAPYFSTAVSTQSLSVLELPKKPPVINTSTDIQYEVGDRLKATCSSGPARPPPSLSWFINDELVLTTGTQWNQSSFQNTNRLALDTRLQSHHFVSGRIVLKCTAIVADIYKETTTLTISALYVHGEPKHERVRFSSASQVSTSFTQFFITIKLLIIFLQMVYSLPTYFSTKIVL